MSLAISSTAVVQSNVETAQGIKTAQKAKSQQEIEGQLALALIQSANINQVPAPTNSSGSIINIKV
ncbi:MAG: hypothetical protein ACSHW0_08910 [Thalassotalea sp.]